MNRQLLFRRLGIVLGVVLIVGAILFSKKLTQEKAEPPRKEAVKTTPSVETFPAKVEEVPTTLSVQGELVAFDKIDIFSEVTGALVSTSRPVRAARRKGMLMPPPGFRRCGSTSTATMSVIWRR